MRKDIALKENVSTYKQKMAPMHDVASQMTSSAI